MPRTEREGHVRRLGFLIGSMIVLTASVGVGVAFAGGGASVAGYGGNAGTAQGQINAATGGNGTLPFTGMNLAFVVLAACVLLGTGLLLRRRGSSQR